MRFFIDEVEVFFPYAYIYPEQYYYMVKLKQSLDAKVKYTDYIITHFVIVGTMCAGDAFRDWKDCDTALSHHFLPIGPSRDWQAGVLLQNSIGDREGVITLEVHYIERTSIGAGGSTHSVGLSR